jgi:hypothetical protein
MSSTALVYSSHDRCEYIHNHWIVQRALAGNKKILFLPMSEAVNEEEPEGRQNWAWGNFNWYFRNYEQYGLDAYPFFWNRYLDRDDVDQLMHELWSAEVVILGGGNPTTGLRHYKNLGEQFYGERGCFGRILHERQDRGLLTVGFSAGVDQVCEFMSSGIGGNLPDMQGFGLIRNLMATSHHEPGQEGHLRYGAQCFPQCMVFGLPNDSGIASDQGWTPGGNIWQINHFITDNSWDIPRDQFHIKTRQGVGIPHYMPDGRHWEFHGGDMMLRIQSPDCSYHEAWIIPAQGGPTFDWWTQQPTFFSNIEDMIAYH